MLPAHSAAQHNHSFGLVSGQLGPEFNPSLTLLRSSPIPEKVSGSLTPKYSAMFTSDFVHLPANLYWAGSVQ